VCNARRGCPRRRRGTPRTTSETPARDCAARRSPSRRSPFASRLSPDERNAVAEDVAHHGFTAAGRSSNSVGVKTSTSRSLPGRVRTASAISTRRSQPFGAMTARSMSLAALASPRAVDPNNTTAWTSDPAAALTTSLSVPTGSTRTQSGATATRCSLIV